MANMVKQCEISCRNDTSSPLESLEPWLGWLGRLASKVRFPIAACVKLDDLSMIWVSKVPNHHFQKQTIWAPTVVLPVPRPSLAMIATWGTTWYMPRKAWTIFLTMFVIYLWHCVTHAAQATGTTTSPPTLMFGLSFLATSEQALWVPERQFRRWAGWLLTKRPIIVSKEVWKNSTGASEGWTSTSHDIAIQLTACEGWCQAFGTLVPSNSFCPICCQMMSNAWLCK